MSLRSPRRSRAPRTASATSASRLLASFTLAAVVLAGCGGDGSLLDLDNGDGGSSGGQTTAPDDGSGTGDPSTDPTDGSSTDPSGGGDPTGEPTDGATNGPSDGGETTAPTPTATNDLGPVGANARAILRADNPRLIVEVDVQQGAEPTQAALDRLSQRIQQVVDKPGGVSFQGGNTFSSNVTAWTSQNLREIAQSNRTHYSGDGTVVVYVLYVRGGFFRNGEETSAIGVAYNGSEMAIFPEKWRGELFATILGSDTNVERSVIVHELGHLLGLVNIGYTSDRAHEDPDHPGHSRSRDSVMYWAIESTSIGQAFNGPPPDQFDADDLADLEGLKSGRL